MGLLEQLQEQGWYITQPGLEKLLEGDKNRPTNPDVKQVVKLALNTDIREYGGGTLSSLTTRGTKVDSFDGFGVVQLVKLRNLGAPKVNEESKTAPRLLKLTITDGQTQYIALEHEHIPALSINTPPGTKILLKSGPIRIAQGVLMLNDKNVTVLGGHVTALVEKWELSRTMAKYAKGGRLQFSTSGPPPWIPFGQKIQQPTAVNSDKDFKSLQTKEKDVSKENSEFNALRNDAIAEATKLGTKKTFGGGAKQMVDANVQKIMDKGYTEEQANNALKLTRNNVERALSNLQRIEYRKQANAETFSGGPPSGKPDSVRSGGKRGFSKREDESELQAKPLGKVSLFDYFGDILQDGETAAATGNSSGGKKTSKESTPNDRSSSHRARSGSAGRVEGNRSSNNNRSQHHASQNHGSSNGGSHHNSSGSASRQNSDGNGNYTGGVPNGGGAKNYSQRFENNISSSFANRNTSTVGPGCGSVRDRGRDQGHYSGQSQRELQSSYKQSDYYGSSGGNSRYSRGANDNHSSTNHSTGAASSGRSGGEGGGGGGRGSRGNDSKYNQQQQQQSTTASGYSNSQQRAERLDSYHGNSTAPSSNGNNAASGGKHGGGGVKSQSNNSFGHGNSYGSEGRNHQQCGNESRSQASVSGKAGSSASAGSNQHHGSSQQQQSSYGNGPKQANYNQQGSGSSSHNSNTNATTNINSQGHYGQQNNSSSYGGGSNSTNKNSNKNNRYGGKDESHKYSDASAPSNTPSSGAASQSKKLSTKGQGSQGQAVSDHRPGQQQSSYGPSSGGKHASQTATANNKVNQLTEQMGSMQVADGGKSVGYGGAANTNNVASGSGIASNASTSITSNKSGSMKQMAANHPSSVVQQHVPQVASPPGATGMPPSNRGGPSPGAPNSSVSVTVTGPGMPKNFIQLPNGYNYNPYQIMGFQNKQTNEFALNVLKSQQHFDPMQQQPTQLVAPPVGSAAVSPVGPGVALPMAATGSPSGVIPSPATVLGGGPSPGAVASAGPLAAPGMAMAQTLATATMAVAYPNWKIGDHCLAKYWEDGGFYTAEITDTSKNTFVVHFLEYGNYEEVLKADCIPITQAGTGAPPSGPMTLSYHPAPATGHMQPPPQPATVPGPAMQYAPLPTHSHHPTHPHAHHHHGHVPQHHAPPPMASSHGAFQAASLPEVVGHANAQPPPSHYAPYKPGPQQLTQAMASQGQTVLTPAMGQYQHTPLHLHQQQQQVQGHLSQHHHHHHHHHQQMQQPSHAQQQRSGGKFREQRPMYVPPAQRK